MSDDFKRGDAVIVNWPDARNGYHGPAKFVRYLRLGNCHGAYDDYIKDEPQCLVRIKGAGWDTCFPLSSVRRAAEG